MNEALLHVSMHLSHLIQLILLSCNFNNFVTLAKYKAKTEDDEDATKHGGVVTTYKILLIYRVLLMYMMCICWPG
jgi:hypothetical protein